MKTITFVCQDDPPLPHGIDEAIGIDGLCHSPERLADHGGEADRAVLVLHEQAFNLAEVQKALRSLSIDPLGAQILEAAPGMSPDDLELSISGLRRRAAAFGGSEPEHAKPVLPRTLTRRDLLKRPMTEYLAAPMIEPAICAAGDGCRACVEVCPQDAYKWHQGKIHYNKDICEPCGRCVTTCPTEAISNPAATPPMLKAQIEFLVEESEAPIGIRFVCSRRLDRTTVDGWFDIDVPCTGMVPGSWLVAAVILGAGSVTATRCSDNGCSLGLGRYALEAIDFAREALAAAGLEPQELVQLVVDKVATQTVHRELEDPFGRSGPVEVMVALSSLAEQPLSFSHKGAATGIVEIDPVACTLCTQCAQTCPTEALGHSYEGDTVSLTFDAAACTNCRQCISACPEKEHGAITVKGRVDAHLLTAGVQTLNEGTILSCETCGKPIAPSKMMDRIGDILGSDFTGTMGYLTRRCIDCRGLA